MPAVKTKRISTLIESQLPQFISSEYELFSKFVQKYYEAQEVQGGTLDIISNLQKYADIDYYEQNLLKQNDTLAATITDADTTIVLSDASSFPTKNGYIRIDDEIIFYATRSDTTLFDCSRGVSGNTTLGDLYNQSNFTSTDAAPHNSGQKVFNVSNLFLYAFVKNFESQYLGSFPEKYLKGEVDKRTLIKNIQKFYKAKGTDSSIKFIFNTIIAKDVNNKPEVYKPRDFTYKTSNSDWVNVYALKAKVISGDPKDLIGKKVVQQETAEYSYADAIVDNVYSDGTSDNEQIWNIVLAPETVNGSFAISTKTKLERPLSGTASTGDRINVSSTIGWSSVGSVLIGTETITFDDKNVSQFTIKSRNPSGALYYPEGTSVYKPVTISATGVTLLTFGVVYNLSPENGQPYASPGDRIQVSDPGFVTADPKIVNPQTNQARWLFDSGSSVSIPTLPSIQSSLSQVATDVSSIFEDDQYYYVTSSSFPSHKILDGSTVNETLIDQKILRIIRKRATRTTEIYKTPKRDVGVLLNGVPVYGFRDSESIRFGLLEEIQINTQGRGYAKPPFVLIDQVPNKARAILSGQVVESIVVDTQDVFPKTPEITITSGRRAEVRAIITDGKVTSLVIDNPGEYYSSPPLVRIRDSAGRGRFANYEAIVSTEGKITGFTKIDEGNFYNQNTVIVEIVAVGNGATGIPLLKEWNFNRFEKLKRDLDTENGYIFQNFNRVLEYGYGYIANPKALRVALSDNINNAGTEPATKTHSPIIGFAYDGNPIYGPFGHQNPLDPQSPIVRMTSGYSLNGSRSKGPSITKYPLGTFVNDYTYTHKSGSLDQNNGRFCITPDFPQGTYAYFLTINSSQVPQFPYFIGENFYSLPVDSNYNSNINQNDIPKNSRKYFVPGMQGNGSGVSAFISEVNSGTIDDIDVVGSSTNFSVNSQLYFDNTGTEGSEVESIISSVKGKSVNYLQSKEDKVVKLQTIQTAYLFVDDILRQPSSTASGTIVGTVKNDNLIVLKDVVGTFDNTGTFSADIKTFSVLLDQRSSYTQGATLFLTNGVDEPIAEAEVLEGTVSQNIVQIKVTSGAWVVDENYFIQSSNLFNTSGTRIVRLTSLSDNLEPFDVNQSVALIETAENHGLGIGDNVIVDINPDDTTKLKTYYLRKRLYQEATLIAPKAKTTIDFTGIGRYQILNGGAAYTPGTYNNVALTGGSGSGATAIIQVSSTGVVSSIVLQNPGTGYKKADYLGVEDESLVRSGGSQSNQRLALYVDHVGFSAESSSLVVASSIGFSVDDLISVGKEIVKIVSINDDTLIVERSKEGTVANDHFDGEEVSLYKARYNFDENYQIFSGNNSGYIQSYDPDTQKVIIVYDYSTLKTNANDLKLSSSFFDSSTPSRLVSVRSAELPIYKFEFSEDNNTFVPNPIVNLQEYYKYKFDTSHSSLTGTYFDVSPSRNYNLITAEKIESSILPGNSGAFIDLKFGFGSRLAFNAYDKKVGTDFTNFYYFDKKNVVDSDGSYFKIFTDPLQGSKKVTYVTPNRFVYDITSEPLWDGSGTIKYTTTGQFAIGEIDKVSIINLGLNYKKVPAIIGADPNESFRASARVLFDIPTNTITGVQIENVGSNYVNPKVVIIDGDGVDARFNVVVRNGEIFSITIDNPGKGYTYAPVIQIIEGEVESYVRSSTIGVPKNVTITRNGGAFHLDKTVASTFRSNYVVSLRNYNGDFRRGEVVVQRVNGTEVARAVVAEWRFGSNLLKLEKVQGIIRENETIQSLLYPVSGVVSSIFVTGFNAQITSFYDNLGYYTSDRGRLGVSNQKITDSFFYQDYSYVVKSKTPIDQWRELIKSTTHPAGFKLFGQVDIESLADAEMPQELPKASHFSIIQLWDPEKNKITVENTTRIITQTIQKVESQRVRKGIGTAATSEFDFNEIRAFEFRIYNMTPGFYDTIIAAGKPWWSKNPFDGYLDSDGKLQGSTTFQLRDDSDVAFFPLSEKNLIVSLDGVLQEPGVAYTINQDKIVFSAPPFGPGAKQTGEGGETSEYKGVTFYGKYFAFKDNQYNTKYFKKIRNIFQRGGRWLDAANQIERNVEFIVEETIGYARSTYPYLDWSTKQDDYQDNIRYILDAIQHDIRFGGNVKIVDYVSLFATGTEYLYIRNYREESINIFAYAARLAKLAIRNWDYIDIGVTYIQGSFVMNVTDSDDLAVGMYVSSGRAYPPDTRIVSIDSQTQVTLSHFALSNSGGGGGAPEGSTFLSGSSSGDITIPTNTGVVQPGDTYIVELGDTLTTPPSFSGSDQATFYLSGINNGAFYDASNLIEKNRAYIQEESIGWAKATYPSLNWEDPNATRQNASIVVNTLRSLDPGSVIFTDRGDGYETAPELYVFANANTVVDPTNTTGFLWELSADLERLGYIKSISITNGGSGYDPAFPPTIEFLGDMYGMEATPVITGGVITDILIPGYTIGQRFITINGIQVEQETFENDIINIVSSTNDQGQTSPGSGAEAEIVLGRRVGNIWITEGGELFSAGTPIGYIRGIGGNGSGLDAQCNVRKFTTFEITNPGYGYIKNPTPILSVSNAGQFLPSAKATTDSEGRITAVTIEYEGSFGYTVTGVTFAADQFAPGGTYAIETKCQRDLGYLIDAYVYHLRFGGNAKVVEFAQLYYRGNKLGYINDELTETLSTYEYAKNLMVAAMRNALPTGTYTAIPPVSDLDVLVDNVFPVCAEVESALNTFDDIINTIFVNGKGLIEVVENNENKSGYWSQTPTYSNYNIINDPQLIGRECADVISAVISLYNNLESVITNNSVPKTLPDYIDGETKEFELYWEDGSPVNTEKDENLFLTLNAVLQRPKYTETYPLYDSYYIDRNVIPNVIKFDVPPIWDQDLGAKTIGEPTSVEKVFGIGVGNYKRLSIDYDLVDGIRTGPFLIIDVEDNTVQNIETDDNLYVFLDGVLQRKTYSYRISGPNIYFNVPIQKEMKIDMRYLYGRDVGQILNIYDFAPDTYFAQGTIRIEANSTYIDNLTSGAWTGEYFGQPIHLLQVKADGSYNIVGQVRTAARIASNIIEYQLKGNNGYIDPTLDLLFAVAGYYSNTFVMPQSVITDVVIDYATDDTGRKLLKDDNGLWSGTFFGKTYRNPFVSLSNGDKIRVEGEDGFRSIKRLPIEATSKDGRSGEQLTDDIYGAVSIESYTGITRGEGLSVVAEIKNGKVLETSITNAGSNYVTTYGVAIPEPSPNPDNKKGLIVDVIANGSNEVIEVNIVEGGENYDIGDAFTIPGGAEIVVTKVLDGYVSNLSWNQRSYDPITQPTAYQYFTPPVLKFIPQDGAGGGARANVLVSKGQVISIDLTDIGSGYAQAPKVIVSRRYDILTERDIGVSVINVGVNAYVDGFSMTASSSIELISDAGLSTVTIESSVITAQYNSYRDLRLELQLERETTIVDIDAKRTTTYNTLADDVELIDVFSEPTYITCTIEGIASNTFVSVNRQITTTLQNLIPNDALSNINFFEVAAYLQLDLDPTDVIVYIADTSKFKNNGYLLIGNEIVKYSLKLNDRFLYVERGEQNTTPQFWAAGTFIRQIPDPVSVAFGGVVAVESESQIATVQVGFVSNSSETLRYNQIVSPTALDPQRVLEVTLMPPNSGAVDYYKESIFIQDPIPTRAGSVDLVEYVVVKRDTTIIKFRNYILGLYLPFISQSLTPTKVGPTIGSFDIGYSGGFAGVSEYTIEQIDSYYSGLTLGDFVDNADTSYTKTGEVFNLVGPSIQDPVQIATQTTSIVGGSAGGTLSVITVSDTYLFPDSGHLMIYTSGFGFGINIISYSGKTATTFTGCQVIREVDTTPGNGGFIIAGTTEIKPTAIT